MNETEHDNARLARVEHGLRELSGEERPPDVTALVIGAGIVAFLASGDAEYITGQVISVSGGLTMHG